MSLKQVQGTILVALLLELKKPRRNRRYIIKAPIILTLEASNILN
jgi:hypothetical protein